MPLVSLGTKTMSSDVVRHILKPFKILRSSCGGGGGSEGDQGGWKVSSGKTTNRKIRSKLKFENNLDLDSFIRFIPNLPFSSYVYDRVKEEEEKKVINCCR